MGSIADRSEQFFQCFIIQYPTAPQAEFPLRYNKLMEC
jgi:hypothetical protein